MRFYAFLKIEMNIIYLKYNGKKLELTILSNIDIII